MANKSTLEEKLKSLGFVIKDIKTSTKIGVLVSGSRSAELEKIAKIFNGKVDKSSSALKVSSIGLVDIDGIKIVVKPISKQGSASAGVENELILINSINDIIKSHGEPLNITFQANNKKFNIADVIEAVEMGRDTSGRKKSDVNLKTNSGKIIPISIKKDNAEIWESADSYWGEKAAAYTRRLAMLGKIKLIPFGSVYKIEPTFAVKATTEEKKNTVFGSDLLVLKGAVVSRTFGKEDFQYSGKDGKLTIKCSHIVTSIEDVKGDVDVWFLVRNDSTRTTGGIKGIRVLAVFEKRINKNVLRVTEQMVK